MFELKPLRKACLFSSGFMLGVLRVGQKTSNDAEQRKVCAHLKNKLDAGFVGQPSKEG